MINQTILNTKNNPLYDFMNTKIMNNISLNEDPDFKNPNKNELQIGLNSKAIGIADPFYSQLTPKDITNTDRLTNTAVGAYQSIDFNNISNE